MRATSVPPATASEPPSQKSFWTSTTMTALRMRRLCSPAVCRAPSGVALLCVPGRTTLRTWTHHPGLPGRTTPALRTGTQSKGTSRGSRDLAALADRHDARRDGGLAARELEAVPGKRDHRLAQVLTGRVQVGQVGNRPTLAHQRALQQPVVLAEFRCSAGGDDLLDGGPGGLVHAVGGLARALALLVLGALGDRAPVDLDELVDHARGGRPRTGHDRGASAVGVDGRGAERGDRVLVEVAADDDACAGRAESVELRARLASQHAEIAGVDADRAE